MNSAAVDRVAQKELEGFEAYSCQKGNLAKDALRSPSPSRLYIWWGKEGGYSKDDEGAGSLFG